MLQGVPLRCNTISKRSVNRCARRLTGTAQSRAGMRLCMCVCLHARERVRACSADRRFVWNSPLLPLLETYRQYDWCVPLMQGAVQARPRLCTPRADSIVRKRRCVRSTLRRSAWVSPL
jgi:hypothetical protein